MPRLQHSYSGYLRMMQISVTKLFVFVEGVQCDPYFYAGVCSTSISEHIRYEINTAQQLPGESGGKIALLAYYEYLRSRKSLVSVIGCKKTTCIFFLDKDIDDLKRKKKRSPHVVYSQYYDVQNYVFQHGDLVRAAGSAASIDPQRLTSALGDGSRWCIHAATLWRDWVALCLAMQDGNINSEANYRVHSRVQTRPYGPTDQTKLQELTRDIARQSQLPVAELRQIIEVSTNRVSRFYKHEQHHRIFKGKWFASILADNIDCIMESDPYDKKGINSKLPGAIMATLDFSKPWAGYYRSALHKIVAML